MRGGFVLERATITIADLPHGVAGAVDSHARIQISRNGGGMGWYLDAQPDTSSEYAMNSIGTLGIAQEPEAQNRLDLLTVVIHEMGHILGLNDQPTDSGIMSGYLPVGIRRLPSIF